MESTEIFSQNFCDSLVKWFSEPFKKFRLLKKRLTQSEKKKSHQIKMFLSDDLKFFYALALRV